MKQFEKWLKGKVGIGWYTGAEEGWKAALEWVLEQEEWQGTDECGCWGVSKEDIEEELNAKT